MFRRAYLVIDFCGTTKPPPARRVLPVASKRHVTGTSSADRFLQPGKYSPPLSIDKTVRTVLSTRCLRKYNYRRGRCNCITCSEATAACLGVTRSIFHYSLLALQKSRLIQSNTKHPVSACMLLISQNSLYVAKIERAASGPFLFKSRDAQRLATVSIFGVIKINNSALSFKRPFFLNRLPKKGMSPRNGTFDKLERSVNS